MWHGPLGLYGWVHDEERTGERRHLLYPRAFLHGIPRALICRRFGHRPIVAGYGKAGQSWPSGESRAKRWVACSRCESRPAWQGDLPVALFPELGAAYTGEWVSRADAQAAAIATDEARRRYYRDARAARDTGGPDVPQVDPPTDLMPAWPSTEWDREGDEHPGPRGAVSVEAPLVPRRWHGWPGFGVGFSLGAGERPVKFHVHAGPLGSLYVGFEGYGRALAHRILGRDMPATRVFELAVDGLDGEWTLHWEVAARRHESSSSDPWWMHGRVSLTEFVLGKAEYRREAIDTREVLIPLPEGRYPAKVTLAQWMRKRTRTRPTVGWTADVEPACGVPVPGKGENAYDCGDDATYSMSASVSSPEHGNEWVTEAVEQFIRGVMRDRARYGAGLDYVPADGWPEQLIRA